MFELNHELLAQIIGFMGTAFIVIGMQQKKYDHFVLCKITNSFLSSVHYLLLSSYTGMCINPASCFTNAVYWRRNKQGKSNVIFQILFGAMFVALGLLSLPPTPVGWVLSSAWKSQTGHAPGKSGQTPPSSVFAPLWSSFIFVHPYSRRN